MSQYTSGELAKLCGVSVRTVQYYDGRGILVPSALSEGGRRLYSEADLEKMKIICFLRELEIPIDSIKKLFEEANPKNVISLLLDEQETRLQREIGEKQMRADTLAQMKKSLSRFPELSIGSIGDAAKLLENRKRLRRLRAWILAVGIIMDALQLAGLALWITKGLWWAFAIGFVLAVFMGIGISRIYLDKTAYICPECHSVFSAGFRESLFAAHTPNTRRLSCPCCGRRGFCVETYRE